MNYNVFRTRFPSCGKWCFPIGKVKKMESRKRVLKHFCFPMEMEHFLGKTTKKSSESLWFTMFSERDFRLAGNGVSPLEKSRKWKVEIAFWNTFVSQWKRTTIQARLRKGAPDLLCFTMFSDRGSRYPKTLWKQMVLASPRCIFSLGTPESRLGDFWDPGFQDLSSSQKSRLERGGGFISSTPGSLELSEISFREGGVFRTRQDLSSSQKYRLERGG